MSVRLTVPLISAAATVSVRVGGSPVCVTRGTRGLTVALLGALWTVQAMGPVVMEAVGVSLAGKDSPVIQRQQMP